jgi:GDP-mannose 6-dehydrogenase
MNITVFGLGYVGAVSAACLAQLGHRVTGVDRDQQKVQNILSGRSPFYEPGLDELIQSNVAAGRLTACGTATEGLRNADVAFVCVGTPSERNGNLGLEQLRRVVTEIAAALEGNPKRPVVAIRSTVFPGTCEEVVAPALGSCAAIVSNPEFLREGVAVKDFIEPSLIVVGGDDRAAVRIVADLYAPLNVEPCLVTLRTAEMIKYACNAFHAVKIAFANEVGALSHRLGVDGAEVMATLCRDEKLNVSAAYLKPGFAFGGSCLPKDLRALVYRAQRMDVKLPLLESALPSNQEHLRRAIDAAMDLPARRLGIIGLAFKENTDDLRESPVVSLLEHLIGKGKDVRVYDPHINVESIYGTNRDFLLKAIPHIGRLMQTSVDGVLAWADHLIVAQKPSPDLAARVRASGLPVLDIVRSADNKALPAQPAEISH